MQSKSYRKCSVYWTGVQRDRICSCFCAKHDYSCDLEPVSTRQTRVSRVQRRLSNIPDLLARLKACSSSRDVAKGRMIHAEATESGADSNLYVASSLVNMYAKCGSLVEARNIFERIPHHDVVPWNALILGYAENGDGEFALELFSRMSTEGCAPNGLSFVAAVKACTSMAEREEARQVDPSSSRLVKLKALERGRGIYEQAQELVGCGLDIKFSNTLLNLYATCGSMGDADQVFEKMPCHSLVSWTVMMLGYAENGEGNMALDLLERMKRKGCDPDSRAFVAALKACTNLAVNSKQAALKKGKEIYSQAAKLGCESDSFVANTAMDMFAKCGSMAEARKVFEKMKNRNAVSWAALILGYAENGEAEVAVELFSRMQHEECCTPNAQTFVAVLKALTSLAGKEDGEHIDRRLVKMRVLEKGMVVHSQASRTGFDYDIFLASSLVDMYAKCGNMLDARRVFDRARWHDVVLWTGLILGYSENAEEEVALELFWRMRPQGCAPDPWTFVAALKACSCLAAKEEGRHVDGKLVKLKSLEKGSRVHLEAARSGCEDIYVSSSLVDMYAKCWSMVDARKVFDRLARRDVVVWTALILGYAENGDEEVSLDLFLRMQSEGCAPNALTFVAVIKACSSLAAKEAGELVDGQLVKRICLEKAVAVHNQATECGCDRDMFVTSTLVDMYANCGSMVEAQRVFESSQAFNVASCTALMVGYSRIGQGEQALELFASVRSKGCVPDGRMFVAAFKACTSMAETEGGTTQVDGKTVKMAALEKGMIIHSEAAQLGLEGDMFVASSLVDMYIKCGCMFDARRVFDKVTHPDVVLWSSLLLGYAENGEGALAVNLFTCIQQEQDESFRLMKSDARVIAAALKACGNIVALETGKQIHALVCKLGLIDEDCVLSTLLVDVYGKCGKVVDAQQVFDSLPSSGSDLVAWTALLAGYSRQGNTELLFQQFQRMLKEGRQPNAVTWVCLLTACSHAGLVETGKRYFEAMKSKFRVDPGLEHYACMVDLLGRANQIDEALQLVKTMPFKPDSVTWMAVLASCRKWNNMEVASVAFESLLRLEGENVAPAAYELMSNIYGSGRNQSLR